MPPRGGPKKRAAPGGDAADAPVAAKLAKPSKTTWYFMSDLRKTKAGKFDEKAWRPFDAAMTAKLEEAYGKGQKQLKLNIKAKGYIIKFADMLQYRADDSTLQRPVKRVAGSGGEAGGPGDAAESATAAAVKKRPAAAPQAGGRGAPPEAEEKAPEGEAAEAETEGALPEGALPTRG